MPVYTYHCDNCGVQFDRHRKFTDQPLTRCPECGQRSVHKVYASVGIVFKGSGFYATDHKSPSGQTARNDKKEESKESKSSKSSKSSESGSE